MKTRIEETDVDVRRLRLEPGDEIILTTTARITTEHAERIKQMAERRWPEHRVTVLGDVEMRVKL